MFWGELTLIFLLSECTFFGDGGRLLRCVGVPSAEGCLLVATARLSRSSASSPCVGMQIVWVAVAGDCSYYTKKTKVVEVCLTILSFPLFLVLLLLLDLMFAHA